MGSSNSHIKYLDSGEKVPYEHVKEISHMLNILSDECIVSLIKRGFPVEYDDFEAFRLLKNKKCVEDVLSYIDSTIFSAKIPIKILVMKMRELGITDEINKPTIKAEAIYHPMDKLDEAAMFSSKCCDQMR